MIAPSIEGERVGDGIENHDKRSGDVDDMTSSGSIDSKRVKAALLAAGSQHTHYRSRAQGNGSPVSSWPPTNHAEHPYGPARHNRRCRKLKIERINNNHAQRHKTTHLRCAHGAQSSDILLKHCDRVVAPIRRCDRIKFKPTRVSQVRNSKMTHLVHAHAVHVRKILSEFQLLASG